MAETAPEEARDWASETHLPVRGSRPKDTCSCRLAFVAVPARITLKPNPTRPVILRAPAVTWAEPGIVWHLGGPSGPR